MRISSLCKLLAFLLGVCLFYFIDISLTKMHLTSISYLTVNL